MAFSPPLCNITEIHYGLVAAEISANRAGGEGDVAGNRMGVSRRGTSTACRHDQLASIVVDSLSSFASTFHPDSDAGPH